MAVTFNIIQAQPKLLAHSKLHGPNKGHVKPKTPEISIYQPGRLRTAHVLALSGWSHSTLYSRMAQGKFPRPEKDGKLSYWRTEVVRVALEL